MTESDPTPTPLGKGGPDANQRGDDLVSKEPAPVFYTRHYQEAGTPYAYRPATAEDVTDEMVERADRIFWSRHGKTYREAMREVLIDFVREGH